MTIPWPLMACAVLLLVVGAGALYLKRRSLRAAAALALVPLAAFALVLGPSPTPASAATTTASQCSPEGAAPNAPAPAPQPPVTPSTPPAPQPVTLGSLSGAVVNVEQHPDASAYQDCLSVTEHQPVVFLIVSDPATGLVVRSLQVHDTDYAISGLPLGTYGITLSGIDLAAGTPASGATAPDAGVYGGSDCNGDGTFFSYTWEVPVPPAGTTVTLTAAAPDAIYDVHGSAGGSNSGT